MKPQRTRGGGVPRPDIHPPDWQTHKHAENFFDQKRERSRLAIKNKCASTLVGDPIPPSALKTPATAEGGTKKGQFYKPLPREFQRDGFNYRQIAREGNIAIYEQAWTGRPEPSQSYEVIRIRRREGFQINGKFVEPAEVYPRSELWGADGFTFTNSDKAWAKFFEMSRSQLAAVCRLRVTPKQSTSERR
jgi:hypothetical protein